LSPLDEQACVSHSSKHVGIEIWCGEFVIAGGTPVDRIFSPGSNLGSSFRGSRLKSKSSLAKLCPPQGEFSGGESCLIQSLKEGSSLAGFSPMSIRSSQGLALVGDSGGELEVLLHSEKVGCGKPELHGLRESAGGKRPMANDG